MKVKNRTPIQTKIKNLNGTTESRFRAVDDAFETLLYFIGQSNKNKSNLQQSTGGYSMPSKN